MRDPNRGCGFESHAFRFVFCSHGVGCCLAQAIGLGWANSENIRANGPTICKRSLSKLPGLWPYGIIVDLRTQADGLG